MSDHGRGDTCSVATVLFERKTKMTDRDPGDDCQGDIVERRRISASRSGPYRPALVAVGIGLMLSLIAAYAVGRWEQRVTKVEFEGVAATELLVMQNGRSEEHTSELQSRGHLVCRLLL